MRKRNVKRFETAQGHQIRCLRLSEVEEQDTEGWSNHHAGYLARREKCNTLVSPLLLGATLQAKTAAESDPPMKRRKWACLSLVYIFVRCRGKCYQKRSINNSHGIFYFCRSKASFAQSIRIDTNHCPSFVFFSIYWLTFSPGLYLVFFFYFSVQHRLA